MVRGSGDDNLDRRENLACCVACYSVVVLDLWAYFARSWVFVLFVDGNFWKTDL